MLIQIAFWLMAVLTVLALLQTGSILDKRDGAKIIGNVFVDAVIFMFATSYGRCGRNG